MEEIKSYLEQEEKSYQDGITLLSKYCANRMLVNTLSKKESTAHWMKLEHELNKVVENAPAAKFPVVATITPPAAPAAPANPDEPGAGANVVVNLQPRPNAVLPGTNAEYDSLITDRGRLFNERCTLSNSLADAATDEERLEIANKIEAIEANRKTMLDKIIHFEQHGSFPAAAPAKADPEQTEMDKADLIKTRNNLRSQLSKAKKAALAKPDDVAKQEKLAKLEVELNSVELQLKLITETENREATGNE